MHSDRANPITSQFVFHNRQQNMKKIKNPITNRVRLAMPIKWTKSTSPPVYMFFILLLHIFFCFFFSCDSRIFVFFYSAFFLLCVHFESLCGTGNNHLNTHLSFIQLVPHGISCAIFQFPLEHAKTHIQYMNVINRLIECTSVESERIVYRKFKDFSISQACDTHLYSLCTSYSFTLVCLLIVANFLPFDLDERWRALAPVQVASDQIVCNGKRRSP